MICSGWIVSTIFVEWLVLGMPGVNKLMDTPPVFLLKLVETLTRFFTGEYVF